MLPKAGKDVGRSTKWVLFDNLKRYGIDIMTDTKVLSVEDGKIQYEKENESGSMQFDHVITASGSRPINFLSNAMAETDIKFSTVGDCIKPGKINDAIHGGFLAAMNI